MTAAAHAAEPADTAHTLREVVVTARRPADDIIPAQVLSGDELRRLNSNSVADALRYFSGVQVKDYGGVGGIKTVNIRSMGTNHTGVVYDGVELGNAQNGQIDLGQFSLDNIEAISLYNGQKSEILQPAKDFGSAGSIYMRTRTPQFADGETYHARATMRTGSFDLINPSALVELRLSERTNASLSAEWLNSSGRYKFRYRRVNPAGELAYDTTAVRENGDINATRLELNFNGTLPQGEWHYNSERGVPGAIVNNVWRRGERIWDTNSFAQGRYTGYFGRFTTLNSIKYAHYRTHYVNNDDKQVKIDNLYKQKELYLSSSNQYEVAAWLRVRRRPPWTWAASRRRQARWAPSSTTACRASRRRRTRACSHPPCSPRGHPCAAATSPCAPSTSARSACPHSTTSIMPTWVTRSCRPSASRSTTSASCTTTRAAASSLPRE